MNAVSTSPFNISMLRKFNTWYSVADGNFDDPNVWRSNGKKKHNYPQPGDDVYIDHAVVFNMNCSLQNLYVSGEIILWDTGSGVVTINGDLQVSGIFDASTTKNWTINIGGINNWVHSFRPGVHSTFAYVRLGDQDIINIPYNDLLINGSGYKNIVGTLMVGGTTLINSGNVVKRTTDKSTFVGPLLSGSNKASFDNTINADLEFRNGFSVDQRQLTVDFGSGNIFFNGTQSLNIAGLSAYYHNYNKCLIMGTSVVTITGTNWDSAFVCHGSITGETPESILNIDGAFAQGTLVEPMSTGIYNYNHGANSSLGYIFDGDYTLPYTSYKYLFINGTGTKTLSGNTFIDKEILISDKGALELSSYDFTVTGQSTASSFLTKNSSLGYTKFIGTFNGTGGSGGKFEFNSPCVIEFQNGTTIDLRTFSSFKICSGSIVKFTTNSQTMSIGAGTVAIDADILISGAINVTISPTTFVQNGIFNGDNAASTLTITGGSNVVIYKNSQQPMQTGILNCNTNDNNFEYGLLADQDITPGVYKNLTLSGSGVKKLLGNISVLNNYMLTAPATLNSNGFALTNP